MKEIILDKLWKKIIYWMGWAFLTLLVVGIIRGITLGIA